MNDDGTPTDEQLRRIERGVQRRIDRRQEVARGITGAAVVVALLGGGIALVLPFAGSVGTATSAGSGGSAASAAPAVAVRCHDSSAAGSRSVAGRAPTGATAAQVAEACGAASVDFQSGTGRMPGAADGPPSASGGAEEGPAAGAASASGSPSTSASASPSLRGAVVVCRARDGVLHVFPADARPATLCARRGMTAF